MSTTAVTAFSERASATEAVKEISETISRKFDSAPPQVLIVFTSPKYNFQELLEGLQKSIRPTHIVGCSSAGEFIRGKASEGAVSVMALSSDEMKFNVISHAGLRKNTPDAAEKIVSQLKGKGNQLSFPYRSLLLLTDALAGETDNLIERVNNLTAGSYAIFGGGAGDDANFSETHVFVDGKIFTDGIVGLEMLSKSPLGIGIQHGWKPVGSLMRVTAASGGKVLSLDAVETSEVFKDFAQKTEQLLNPADPMPFFLHNTLGIQTSDGFKIRVPLALNDDGSIDFASDIPEGSVVSFMTSTAESSVAAARGAIASARKQIGNKEAKAALFFDCVATRLRMGKEFGLELKALEESVGSETAIAGCNTYGQIARVQGQFNGFHNCTAVVCLFPGNE